MSTIRWALVGTSGTAETLFAPVLSGLAGAVLVGAVSSKPERSRAFQEKYSTPRSYRDLDDLAADGLVDAVWVATPNDLHAAQAVQLIESGKNVLVEKPLATSVDDAKKVLGAAQATGVMLRVGYHQRFRRPHQQLRDWAQEGRLGTVRLARFHAYSAYADEPPEWRRDPERSGGWSINDVGTHLIDLLLWALGPAVLETAWLGNSRFGTRTDDTAVLTLRLATGGYCIIDTSTALDSPGSRIEVYGSRGWSRAENSFAGPASVQTSWGTELSLPVEDALREQVMDFNRALTGDGRASVAEDGLLAVENVRLIQEARAVMS